MSTVKECTWVAEAAYREGRLKVLKNFLLRERVYIYSRDGGALRGASQK
jgi:predicted metal-dependent HD superfamily phosphohydrolase